MCNLAWDESKKDNSFDTCLDKLVSDKNTRLIIQECLRVFSAKKSSSKIFDTNVPTRKGLSDIWKTNLKVINCIHLLFKN